MYKSTDLPTRPATRLSAALGVFFLLLIGSVHVSAQAGAFDLSFNSTGYRYDGFGGGGEDSGQATAVQPDGKIVVVGYANNLPGTGRDFAITRYNSDGTLDATFGGGDGKVTTPIGPGAGTDIANAVAIQPDGKIVAAGQAFTGNATSTDFALVRYNADGSLDPSFDGDGKVTTAIGMGSAEDIAYTVSILGDGRIVAAGHGSFDFAVARYNSDGSLDLTFDTDGYVMTPIGAGGSADMVFSAAIQTDGKIVAVGYVGVNSTSGTDFAIARYNADGSLDTSFDTDGKVTTAVSPGSGSDLARGMLIQPDGKIVAAGIADMGGTTGSDFALVRYNTNGSLDTTFDVDGRVTTAIGPSTSQDYAWAVARQTDGKIVAAGYAAGLAGGTDFALVRYNVNGSLDATFDGDGRATTAVGATTNEDHAYAGALQSDGRILAAGRANGASGSSDIAMVRYNANGSLDSTFDTDGKVTTDIGNSGSQANALAVQSDGKTVTAGYVQVPSGGLDFALMRYNTDGSLDTSFDGDGRVTTSTASGSSQEMANSVVIQPDGKIIAAGFTGALGAPEFALVRYNTDGSLDTTFDGDGIVISNVGTGFGNDTAYATALQADGKIVVAGYATTSTSGSLWDLAVARYNTDGSLDTTFDGDGKALVDISSTGNDIAYSIAIQADGKIVAAGTAGSAATGADFAVVRLNSDGSLDTSFDTDGKVTTAIGPTTNFDEARGVAIQPDGKIVAAGRAGGIVGTGTDFGLVRYNNDGSLDASFDADGIVTTAIGPATASDLAYTVMVQSDGKVLAGGIGAMGGTAGNDMALARYNPDGSLDTSFDTDGIATIDRGGSEAVYAMAPYFSNRVAVAGPGGGNFFSARVWLSTVVTAAPVSVTGRVFDVYGRGIRSARVSLTDETGVSRHAMTNTFGYYTFTGVDTGQGYTLSASARGYVFPTRYLQVNEQMTGVDMFGQRGSVATTVTTQSARPQQPAPVSLPTPTPAPVSTPLPAKRKLLKPARIHKKKEVEL